MNKIISGILLSLSKLLVIPSSLAADSEGNYAIWGEGGASCYKYSKARIAEKDESFKAYLRGYLTSFNTSSADTYSISGAKNLRSMLEWLDEYCDEKSIDSYDRAIHMLISDIEDDRYKTPVTQGITKGWGKK